MVIGKNVFEVNILISTYTLVVILPKGLVRGLRGSSSGVVSARGGSVATSVVGSVGGSVGASVGGGVVFGGEVCPLTE